MKKDILIVDDEADIRSILIESMEELFPKEFNFHQASDGAEGMRKVENMTYFLVITDIKMPKHSGGTLIEFISSLKEPLKPNHILVHSAFDNVPKLKASKKNQMFYLPKPLSEPSFKEYLKSIISDKTAPTETFKMDVNFINPFIVATLEVLKITANTEAKKDKVYVKPTDTPSGDISALVSMNSEQFHGSFAVCFEKACYLEVMSNMMMEEYTDIVPDIKDGVGEICNQIFGLTKARMNSDSGILIDKAIPTIITGNKHTISHMIVGKCLVVKFNTSKGSFTIEAIVKGKD